MRVSSFAQPAFERRRRGAGRAAVRDRRRAGGRRRRPRRRRAAARGEHQRAIRARRHHRQPGRRQHDQAVVAPRSAALARAPLGDRAPVLGPPGQRALGRLRPPVQRRAQPRLFHVVARDHERHRRIPRVRRRDQQRVEVHEQLQPRAAAELAAIGQAHQQLVDRRGVVGPAQAIEPHQHRQPRALGPVGAEVAGRRRARASSSVRGRARGLVVLAGARRQRPLGGGVADRGCAARAGACALPSPGSGPPSGKSLTSSRFTPAISTSHGPGEPARAHGQTDDHDAEHAPPPTARGRGSTAATCPYLRAYPHSHPGPDSGAGA